MVSMREMLEAGCHFGHQTRFWNPRMAQYIFGSRNHIHIINLEKTVACLSEAEKFVHDLAAKGGKVLFVDTKRGGREIIANEATRAGMCYVDRRWLGGTLTNFKTIKTRIERLNKLDLMEKTGEFDLLPKKEVLGLKAERDKLLYNLGGIREMKALPGIMFVVDPNCEQNAVKEARKLHIPVVAITDTNCDPDLVDYVISGNDDAIRAVKLIASLIADAVIEAKQGEDAVRHNVEDEENATMESLTESAEEVKEETETAEETVEEKPETEETVAENAEAQE